MALSVLCVCVVVLCVVDVAAADVDFAGQVWPILKARCWKCHGDAEQSGSLRIDSRERLVTGGDSGQAIVPEDADGSYLVERVSDPDPDSRMPPEGDPLTADQIALLRRWIAEGAVWDEGFQPAPLEVQHWAFEPVSRPDVPQVHTAAQQPAGPIDAFLIRQLDAHGLQTSRDTDPRTFLRRATLDLTGLPPTPDEVGEFLESCAAADGSLRLNDRAVSELIDRLLAAPGYGERWAQHWLDVIRYADTQGYELNEIRPGAWPYRDYVIAALNDDVPYPRFLLEQLAGDTLGVDAAAGFLVTPPTPSIQEVGQEPEAIALARFNILDEVVQNVGSAIIGLSIGCARCHNHKFDPLTSRDYYRFVANFSGLQFEGRPWDEGRLPLSERAQAESEVAQLRQQLAEFAVRRENETVKTTDRFPPVRARWIRLTILRSKNSQWATALEEIEAWSSEPGGARPRNVAAADAGAIARSSGAATKLGAQDAFLNDGKSGRKSLWIASWGSREAESWAEVELPQPEVIDAVTWHCSPYGPGGGNLPLKFRVPASWKIEIAEQPGEWVTVIPRDRSEGLSQAEQGRRARLESDFEAAAYRLYHLRHVFAGEFGQPDLIHVLKRGDPQQPGEPIGPGGIDVLGRHELPADVADAARRRALAEWLGSDEHPLTARVIVNRVWMHHFGSGLVNTPSDFGTQGERPSHPELLDWLASDFMHSGWRIKDLHRLICTSRAYRQRSEPCAKALEIDADSRLLWRFPPRRLEAEAIRDSILHICGTLDPAMGGPGVNIYDPKLKETSGEWRPRPDLGPETWRRSIYLMRMRGADDGVFKSFDIPDCGQVRAKRSSSTTPLQALNLFNSRFVLEQADRFAERVECESGDDLAQQIDRAFLLALSREPADDERTMCQDVAHEHGLATVCRVLLNSNEFLLIE